MEIVFKAMEFQCEKINHYGDSLWFKPVMADMDKFTSLAL